jgi:hypothetical protein
MSSDLQQSTLLSYSLWEAAVYDSRKRAKDAAAVAASAQSTAPIQTGNADASWPKPVSHLLVELKKVITSIVDGMGEYVDPEYFCKISLPVDGDKIVGTIPKRVKTVSHQTRMHNMQYIGHWQKKKTCSR